MSTKKIEIEFGAKFESYMQRLESAQNKTSASVGKMEQGFQRISKSILSIGVAYKAFGFLKNAVDLSIEQAQSVGKVEQAVRQTGGAAGYSTERLKRMASQLQEITGTGDDKILNDVSLQLLTFGNISGKTFDRAQKAALDLSAVIGTDLRSQTIQLGKALDNPLEGMTALRRSGIMFTDEQERTIKKLVSQNRLWDAQQIILNEIESKYGGQAEAMNKASGGIMVMKEAWGDAQEEAGNFFLTLTKNLIPELTKGLKGLQILLGGDKGGYTTGKEERQLGFYESIAKYTKDQIKSETEIAKQNYEVTDKKIKGYRTLFGIQTRAFRNLLAEREVYKEQLEVLMNIGAYKEAANRKPTKTTDEDAVKKAQRDKEESIKKYYETVTFLDKNYYAWKSEQIKKEAADLNKMSKGQIDQAAYVASEMSKLADEQSKFFELPNFLPTDEDFKRASDEYMQFIDDIEEAFTSSEIERYEKEQDAMQRLYSEQMDAIGELGYALESAFDRSGKGFLHWANAALQTYLKITSIMERMDAGDVGKTGGWIGIVTSVLGLFGLHGGGSVANIGGRISYSRIPRFSTGTDFIVPRGYPNDSYPILVESGERVTVTPASQVAGQSFSDRNIITELKNLENSIRMLAGRPIINNQYLDGKLIAQNTTQHQNGFNRRNVKFGS